MTPLDEVASSYRTHGATAALWPWEGADEFVREKYRADVRVIAGLLADEIKRVGYGQVCSADDAVTFLRKIAGGVGLDGVAPDTHSGLADGEK